MAYAGLVGLCICLGITLLSPIGGKLGDIFGRRAVVVIVLTKVRPRPDQE